MKKLKILIIEPENIVVKESEVNGRRLLEEGLVKNTAYDIVTINKMPNSLSDYNVIILNNLQKTTFPIQEDKIIEYVSSGGGLLCIHDTISPIVGYKKLMVVTGLQESYDTYEYIIKDNIIVELKQILAIAHERKNPLYFVPVKTVIDNDTHPILENINEFELEEEYWAVNVSSGVKPLLIADVNDRIFSPPRYRLPIPICGCKINGKGRSCYFLPLHYPENYKNPNVLKIINNCILWLSKLTHDNYDIFLSFSHKNRKQANKIYNLGKKKKLRIFMSEKELKSGDKFEEKIRRNIKNSKEVAVLVTSQSVKSMWVQREAGTSWFLNKRITPITYKISPSNLPEILGCYHARKYNEIDLYFDEVLERVR